MKYNDVVMFIDILLLAVFISSLFMVWYRVSQKIPHLAIIPEEVIKIRLREEASGVRLFLLELKSFYKEDRYKEWLRRFTGKALYRFHILLLRTDNKIVGVLKNIITEANPAVVKNGALNPAVSNNSGGNPEVTPVRNLFSNSAAGARGAFKDEVSDSIVSTSPSRKTHSRMEEVRKKRKSVGVSNLPE